MNGIRGQVRRIASAAVLLAAGILTALGGATPASALGTDEVYETGTLRIVAFANTQMTAMAPGMPVDWQISVEPKIAGTGHLDIGFGLASEAERAAGLNIEVFECSVKWVSGVCSGIQATWVPSAAVATAFLPLDLEGVAHAVASVPVTATPAPVWLLVRVTPSATLASHAYARFTIAVAGLGEPLIVSPNPGQFGLVSTGVPLALEAMVIAALVLGGVLLIVRSRNSRRSVRGRFNPSRLQEGDEKCPA